MSSTPIVSLRLRSRISHPREDFVSQLSSFVRYCEAETGRRFEWPPSCREVGRPGKKHDDFHAFSVREFRSFWRLFLAWSKIICDGAVEPVCEGNDCETAQFFPALRLNYPENLLALPNGPALIAYHGDGRVERLTREKLRELVMRLAGTLGNLGVRAGDRVVCIARNNCEAVIAALATATLGAVFSSCGPDMGSFAILSRFAPLAPVVMFANTRAESWDVGPPIAKRVAEIVTELPALQAIIGLDDGPLPIGIPAYRLDDMTEPGTDYPWKRRAFDHPLFALFSSGTTGAPKCILHSAGGTLLEHVKEHRLHCDLRPGERLLFQTSCGWMMWNWQLSALASGAEIVLYDGPLLAPETLWQIVARERVSVFGTNPAYLRFCEDADFSPRRELDLSALRAVLSTGSILYPRQFDWAAEHVGNVPLQSISGGTDIIGCFVLGHPELPVRRGETQCRSLGLDVRAVPRADEPDCKVGELVCGNPFPSRPIGLWNDPDGSRFHAAYFSQNPGMWTHGDLIEFTEAGGAVLHGRSDGVLNIRGVRVGPAEIYAALSDVPEIADAMAVEQIAEDEPGGSRLILLVRLNPGANLDAVLAARMRSILLARGSPAMVPARIADVSALPETYNGKRSEAAARSAVNGKTVHNRAVLSNPECLDEIAVHPALRALERTTPPQDQLPLDNTLEEALQSLCEQVLEVAPIDRKDNLFSVRGDSLASITLLMEIERRTGRRLPVQELFASPSIEGIARLLRKQRITRTSPIAVRPAEVRDVEKICELLHRASVTGDFDLADREVWYGLFSYHWIHNKPDLGFVLAHGDEIVGFLGTIYSKREINGKEGIVCNFSSWYVSPQYRGWGISLLNAAIREDVTYTSLTPGPLSQQIFKMLGFASCSNLRLLMPPSLHPDTLRHPLPIIVSDPTLVRPLLDRQQQQVFDDHAAYCLQLLLKEDNDQAYIIVRCRKMPIPQLVIRVFSQRSHSTSSDRLCMCLRIANPTINRVGNGGRPGTSL